LQKDGYGVESASEGRKRDHHMRRKIHRGRINEHSTSILEKISSEKDGMKSKFITFSLSFRGVTGSTCFPAFLVI
jgi:hypothetical protein